MAKEYKSGDKRFYIGSDGYKRNRANADRLNSEYKSRTYRRITLLIRKDDTDVLEKLDSVEPINAYIVDLIRKDIKASKS